MRGIIKIKKLHKSYLKTRINSDEDLIREIELINILHKDMNERFKDSKVAFDVYAISGTLYSLTETFGTATTAILNALINAPLGLESDKVN